MRLNGNVEFPAVLPGFESINRYWDARNQTIAAKILPGEYYVTSGQELITTVLGSCVSACIRDRITGVGGMNHFLLPLSPGETWSSATEIISLANRYGNYAMEHLINDILKNGGKKNNLEIKIFGGSQIIHGMSDIGASNIEFVRNYAAVEGLDIVAADVSGTNPRKVVYYPHSGRVMVKRIRELHNSTILKRESAYIESLGDKSQEGEIELFN